MSDDPMPAVFIGHGSPMNALESNASTAAWARFAASIRRPRAIVSVSAHWYIGATAVTAMAKPRTIHDFGGFPAELHSFQYPAPGSATVAGRVAELLAPETEVVRDEDSWGLDHGTWSVLAHLYPAADIPVVQLSIDATKEPIEHIALGALLDPLRSDDILIVGSGNVVHNLAAMSPAQAEAGFDWAVEFDDAATRGLGSAPASMADLTDHPAYRLAAPTPDHLIPLYYLAGVADASDRPVATFNTSYAMGSLSMTCHTVH